MVLIVEPGCPYCKEFEGLGGLKIAVLMSHLKPPVIELDGVRMPPPFQLVGVPTLLDGEKVYVGREPVRTRLEEYRRTKK
jgi:hypothetical protein